VLWVAAELQEFRLGDGMCSRSRQGLWGTGGTVRPAEVRWNAGDRLVVLEVGTAAPEGAQEMFAEGLVRRLLGTSTR
jgi:hypothetical protein